MPLQPLSDLFLGSRSAEHPVAWDRGTLRTWEDFRQGVARVAAQARGAGGQRWILACEEAWDFAVGGFGLLAAGCTLVLPPNFQPETLARLREGADGLLRKLPAGASPPLAPARLSGTFEFWTSGTTGEPKAVRKDLAQLDAEVALLERLFGAGLGAGPMVGTVPHHHIYGCLFRLLWPLAAGRPLRCEPCGDPAGFRAACAGPEGAAVLVSSPAHLSRLPRLMALSELPAPPRAIFSSGGPLSRADALAWLPWVPGGVLEIYGSTESGGIAWRRQSEAPESALWTPLPDVNFTLEATGALVVSSFRAGPAPLVMDDAAEAGPHGTFRLLGRLDRTLKLEEKRVSLPELEAALESHPWVARAAVVLLEGPRPALGAVVVLHQASELTRLQLARTLRRHLALRFEPVALPRHWRFPEGLPYDGRGKLTVQALRSLFEHQQPLPPATLLRRAEGEAVFTLSLPPELPAFQGHFPGDPVLPGVVQVDWAIRLGQAQFGPLGSFEGLEQLKFLEAIRPLEAPELTLTLAPGRLRFRYACGAARKSSGQIRFQGAP